MRSPYFYNNSPPPFFVYKAKRKMKNRKAVMKDE